MNASLLNKSARVAAFGPTHDRNIELEYQLAYLGLDSEIIGSLRGQRTLDIACGIGELVTYLRSQGVRAEGIDPRAPSKEGFTQRRVFGVTPERGIPAQDGAYSLITCNQCIPFNEAFGETTKEDFEELAKSFPEVMREYTREHETAIIILSEISRTLRTGGEARIFPHLQRLDENNSYFLKFLGLSLRQEEADERDLSKYSISEEAKQLIRNQAIRFPEKMRTTVLTKS